VLHNRHIVDFLQRVSFPGGVQSAKRLTVEHGYTLPCVGLKDPPLGPDWVHEVKHVREWNFRWIEKANKRLAQEKVFLFKLNDLNQFLQVQYLTKGEAVDI
jgi:hypothetical protein